MLCPQCNMMHVVRRLGLEVDRKESKVTSQWMEIVSGYSGGLPLGLQLQRRIYLGAKQQRLQRGKYDLKNEA